MREKGSAGSVAELEHPSMLGTVVEKGSMASAPGLSSEFPSAAVGPMSVHAEPSSRHCQIVAKNLLAKYQA